MQVCSSLKQGDAYQYSDTSKPPGPLLTETLSPASNLQFDNIVVSLGAIHCALAQAAVSLGRILLA